MNCPHCEATVEDDFLSAGNVVRCPHCQELYELPPLAVVTGTSLARNSAIGWSSSRVSHLRCQHCGGRMARTDLGRSNAVGVGLGCGAVIVGIVLLFIVPPFSTIVGVVMIVVGLLSGGKPRPVWRCQRCETIVERG